MSDFTPSTDDVRDRYADARVGIGEWARVDESVKRSVEEAYGAFDRWIAGVRADAVLKVLASPSAEVVERAAQRLFDDGTMGGGYLWAELAERDASRAEMWREDARRILKAALVGGESDV